MASLRILVVIFAIIFVVETDQAMAKCLWSTIKTFGHCKKFVKAGTPYVDPTPKCCTVLKIIDIPCACDYMTYKLTKRISTNKLANVLDYCGTAVAPGTRCGGTVTYFF